MLYLIPFSILTALVFEYETCLSCLSAVQTSLDAPSFFAQKVHNALKGLGTKDNVLIRILVSRSEVSSHGIVVDLALLALLLWLSSLSRPCSRLSRSTWKTSSSAMRPYISALWWMPFGRIRAATTRRSSFAFWALECEEPVVSFVVAVLRELNPSIQRVYLHTCHIASVILYDGNYTKMKLLKKE